MNELKQRNEDFFNIVNDAITVHDDDFNIISANSIAKELLGLELNTIFNQKCFKSYHGTDCPPKLCPSCCVLKTGIPASSEVFEPHLNKHIEIRAFPRFDKNGKLIGLLHIVRDISARKQMEDELKKSVSKLTAQTKELNESNIAFKHLLAQREIDKKDLEEEIMSNIRLLVLPYIDKLKMTSGSSDDLQLINELETNIINLISPFSHRLSSESFGLTPKEIKIANLIREGRQDKEISDILNIALETVKTH
jgi:hypothetical protein